jgi:hypothetical protein
MQIGSRVQHALRGQPPSQLHTSSLAFTRRPEYYHRSMRSGLSYDGAFEGTA